MPRVEIAPGLFLSSEAGDIDREMKTLMRKMLEGADGVKPRIRELSDLRMELLFPTRRLPVRSKT